MENKMENVEKIELTSKNGTVNAVLEKEIGSAAEIGIDLVKETQAIIDEEERRIDAYNEKLLEYSKKVGDMTKKLITEEILVDEFYQVYPENRELDCKILLQHDYYKKLMNVAIENNIKTFYELCRLRNEFGDELEKLCVTKPEKTDEELDEKDACVKKEPDNGSEFSKRLRDVIEGVIDRDTLEIDAMNTFGVRNAKNMSTHSILSLAPYSTNIEEACENNKKIKSDVDKIIKANAHGIKTRIPTSITYKEIEDKSADSVWQKDTKKGYMQTLKDVYIKQTHNKKFYRQPSLFAKLLVGFANVFLKPIKIKLFLR